MFLKQLFLIIIVPTNVLCYSALITQNKWKKSMEFYLTAVMRERTEKEKYRVFQFLIGDQGRGMQ